MAKKEKADLDILIVACLLRDIGRKEEMKSRGKFCHCIISHRYRNQNIPKTIEAKVLFDADKIDSIGAVGVGHDFLFAGYLGHSMYTGNKKKLIKLKKDQSYTIDDTAIMEYEYKLKNIKNKILTKTGKKIAKNRHDFMVSYFKRFWQEVNGTI